MRQRNGSRIVHVIIAAACGFAMLTGCAGLAPNADMALITSFDDAPLTTPGTAAVTAPSTTARAATRANDPVATTAGDSMTSAEATPVVAAVARWRRCVDRQLESPSPAEARLLGAVHERLSLGQRIALACEGHRRDVARHYPPHLERRVVASLTRQERRLSAVHERTPDADRSDLVGALDSAFRALDAR